MITGKTHILQWFDSLPDTFRHWIVYEFNKNDSGVFAMRSTPDENLDRNTSRSELSRALEILNGRFTIVMMEGTNRKTKGDFKMNIEVSPNINGFAAPQQGLQGPASSEYSDEKVQKMIKDAIAADRRERELDDMKKRMAELEKENKELKKETSGYLPTIMGYIGPYLPKMFGQPAAMAGAPTEAAIIDQPTTTDMTATATEHEELLTDDQHQKLSAIVHKFCQIDPTGEWLNTLARMALKAEQNPAMLETVKMFL